MPSIARAARAVRRGQHAIDVDHIEVGLADKHPFFERDGYVNARLTDITAEAKVSTGSFYTYFTGKEDIFAAVLETVQGEMLHPHVREATGDLRRNAERQNEKFRLWVSQRRPFVLAKWAANAPLAA